MTCDVPWESTRIARWSSRVPPHQTSICSCTRRCHLGANCFVRRGGLSGSMMRRKFWLAVPRRSAGDTGSSTDRFLLDTIGELSQAYALADVVVIGRSFGSLHGSDMIEPIGLGIVTIVGQSVSDFRSIVDALLDGDGLIQCDRTSLSAELSRLLENVSERRRIARNGQAVILSMQGATERTATALLDGLGAELHLRIRTKKQPRPEEGRRFGGRKETDGSLLASVSQGRRSWKAPLSGVTSLLLTRQGRLGFRTVRGLINLPSWP